MADQTTASGIVVVDKQPGWTSHQVVGRCRRLLGTKKVGHAGTLDPMATGVLVVGVNRATRLLGHLMLTEKAYDATIRFGRSTITDDAEGEVVESLGAPALTREQVAAAMPAYTGDIQQVPTAVSAIKVNGERAYAKVRAGEQVELRARPVTVHELTLLDVREAELDGVRVVDADVRVRCSSGTYIRALARDIGRDLGTGGHLTALRRTAVGPFTLERAQPVDGDTDAVDMVGIDEVAAACFPTYAVDDRAAKAVSYGQRLDIEITGLTAIMHEDRFLALYVPEREDGPGAKPEAVFI
ncbi:tRNA pseudouridine(55) synthase TruB [Mariniluteicoccus endophyticus]